MNTKDIIKNIKDKKKYIHILLLLLTIIILCLTLIISRTHINNLKKDVDKLNQEQNNIKECFIEIETKNSENSIKVMPTIEVLIIKDNEVNNISETNYKNRWNITLSDDEINMLAQIVWLEAGNQCQDGQMAVVEVIFNRMIDSYYNGTLEEVLSRPGQFATWKNRNIATPTGEVYGAIYKVLYGQSNILPYNTLYFARGSGGREVEIKIQDHVFCNK